MFNLGPGRLGDLLESIAIPEIRQQAFELASTLADRMSLQYAVTEKRTTGAATPEFARELVTV